MMSSQRGEAQPLREVVPLCLEGVLAGRLVVKPVWGQRGLVGSFTTHASAATSQSEMTSPLGSAQSSSVLLVHVPAPARRPGEPAPPAQVPWCPASRGRGHRGH